MEILATSKDGQNRAAADPWMVVHLSSGLATEGPESLANAAGDVAVFSFWAGRG